jgi:predicted ribosomally synthesized peptide with SipW-like signal peptide
MIWIVGIIVAAFVVGLAVGDTNGYWEAKEEFDKQYHEMKFGKEDD